MLDRVLTKQDWIFDYKSMITATGNRSFGDSFDFNTLQLKYVNITHLVSDDIVTLMISLNWSRDWIVTCDKLTNANSSMHDKLTDPCKAHFLVSLLPNISLTPYSGLIVQLIHKCMVYSSH